MFKKLKIVILSLGVLMVLLSICSISAADLNNSEVEIDDSYSETLNMNNNENNVYKSAETKTIGLNSTTFDTYVTNGQFNDRVSDGDTIDVNGKLDGERFSLTVNKSLNFISSNNNSYIDFQSSSNAAGTALSGGEIIFDVGSNGSNITNLYFYNTRVTFSNTSNILVNNISVINKDKVIGSGTGHFILNKGSKNITINNSYFYTKDNGQRSTVVFTGASNCTFENNTVVGEGAIGNLVYINSFNRETDDENNGIIIRNNLINATAAPSQITCFAIDVFGSNHLIENNTVLYSGYCLSGIWGESDYENITIKNNYFQSSVILGNTTGIQIKSMKNVTITNNTIGYLLIDNAYMCNNIISTTKINGNNAIYENNTGKTLTIIGNNTIIKSNTLNNMNNYTINNSGINNTIINNVLVCINSSSDESIINSTELFTQNNSDEPRHLYITLDNYLDYGEFTNTYYRLKTNLVHSKDWINIDGNVIDTALNQGRDISCSKIVNLTFFNMTNMKSFRFLTNDSTFINCYLPGAIVGSSTAGYGMTYLINSTIEAPNYASNQYNDFSCITLDENSQMLVYLDNNTYPWYYNNIGIFDGLSHYFRTSDGTSGLKHLFAVNDSSTIRVFHDENSIIFVDRILYFEGILSDSTIRQNITFVSGSMGSTAKNIIFNEYVILNESGIIFTNCTFNKGVIFNNVSDIIIKDCTFNTTDTPLVMIGSEDNTIDNNTFIDSVEHETNTTINMIGSSDNIIKNNTITTVNQYTIQTDDESTNNKFTENILQASTTIDKETTNINDNNVYTESKTVRYNTNITVELNNQTNIHVTDKVPLTINVYYEDNKPVTNGEIEIYADGIFQTREKLENGTYNTEVTFDRLNSNNTIKVWYYADDTYFDSVTNISNINVEKSKVIITPSEISGRVGENITLEANITTEAGALVNEGNVYFIFGTEKYSAKVINGTATYIIEIQPEWIDLNKVTIQYFNSTIFIGNNIKVTPNITIQKITTNIELNNITSLTSISTTITATVTDENNINLNEGTVTFTDTDGNIIAQVDVNDGIATTTIIINEETNTTITATYNPTNPEYSTSTTTATLTIQKPATQLNIEDVNLVAGKTVTLTATLTDQLGNNITGGKVVFKVNGKTVKDTTGKVVYAKVVDGVATVDYTVPTTYADKELNITASYTGTSTYNKETATIIKTATKPTPTLSITPITSDVQSGSTIKIEAKVATGDVPITTGKIVFKLNGKTLKDANGKVIYAQVDVNGTVSFDYNIGNLNVNTYNLTATFISTGYDKLTANTTINVVKA